MEAESAITASQATNNNPRRRAVGATEKSLRKAVLTHFAPRHVPNHEVLIAQCPTTQKAVLNKARLQSLSISETDSASFPDIVIYDSDRNWLFLIDVVAGRGRKSKDDKWRFQECIRTLAVPTIYVSAFSDRMSFGLLAERVSWNTVVWIASEPDHLIHFNADESARLLQAVRIHQEPAQK